MSTTTYNNTDFLRFSAYSIKELITRKLSEDTTFTDQVYEGSNLAVLIDIFSHMAQCLLYSLNNAASESMFSDTQIYENMNRLVKFIDYHPSGVGVRTMQFSIDNSNQKFTNNNIYKYSYIDTGRSDNNGKHIYYSTIDDVSVNSQSIYDLTLYNGKWKLYSTVFTSSGEKYQKFILTGLQSTQYNLNTTVGNNQIHVYIKQKNSSTLEQYSTVTAGVFINNDIQTNSIIYSNNDYIVDLRLNENKTYEITFGNGYTGKIPEKDASIYIMYLDTNGPSDEILANDLTNLQLKHNASSLGMSTEIFNLMFPNHTKSDIYKQSIWKNTSTSTKFVPEESVEEIRTYAPQWFKTGNRLVTNADYVYFFKNRYRDQIIDVKCQNNYEYISTLYRWLYDVSINGAFVKTGRRTANKINPNYYINQNKIIKYDYKWADASDSNNVYLWIKMRNDSDMLKSVFNNEIENIKTLTAEPVYLTPLTLYFAPCAETIDTAITYFDEGTTKQFDAVGVRNNYIEITLDDNCLYSNLNIKNQVADVIIDFFDEESHRIGEVIRYNTLVEKIYNLKNIAQIRTVYQKDDVVLIKPGISFATWSDSLIDVGDDLDVSTSSRQLEPFQFPKLYNSNQIAEHIKIVKKSVSNINTITY